MKSSMLKFSALSSTMLKVRTFPHRIFSQSLLSGTDTHWNAFPNIIPTDIHTSFNELIATRIQPHPAAHHPLFSSLVTTAKQYGVTPEQFNRFREVILARVHTTVPSIFILGQQAALKGDFYTMAVALQNLKEEGGEAIVEAMHPIMMADAFNTLGKEVFGLPPVTLKACYENTRLPAAYVYRAVVNDFYLTHGPSVSFAQELASGGDNTPNNPGMMGDMYKLFYLYKDNMPKEVFEKHVLPYFAAHLSVHPVTHEQVFDGKAIELKHRILAQEAAMRQFTSVNDIQKETPYMIGYLDAQHSLFNAAEQYIQQAKDIGTPIRPLLQQKQATVATNNVVPFSEVYSATPDHNNIIARIR